MREAIVRNISTTIDARVVEDLVSSYETVIAEYRAGDLNPCLTAAGRFVDNALRAVECIRTGRPLPEIKSVATTVKGIEADKALPESLRLLVPRVAQAMVYDIRSKRGALHVKEIDPRHIDAALCVQGASWILAEFIRLYHVDGEQDVAEAMASLMRGHVPFVEVFDGETTVTSRTPCSLELLLLLARAVPGGLNRRALGKSSRYAPATVTRSVGQLLDNRYVFKTRQGVFHITGPGEDCLASQLASAGRWSGPFRITPAK